MWRVELDALNKVEQCEWHAVSCRVTLSGAASERISSETILPHMPGS